MAPGGVGDSRTASGYNVAMTRGLSRTLPLIMLLLILAGAAAAVEPLPPLYGVVLSAQDGAAYLEDPVTGWVRAYRVGDTIGESQLVRIEPNRVILQRGGEQVEVRLAGVPESPGAAPALANPPPSPPSASEGGDATTRTGEPGPCPPSCPPASVITPAPPAAGQPCPPACPPAETLGFGQAGPNGAARCQRHERPGDRGRDRLSAELSAGAGAAGRRAAAVSAGLPSGVYGRSRARTDGGRRRCTPVNDAPQILAPFVGIRAVVLVGLVVAALSGPAQVAKGAGVERIAQAAPPTVSGSSGPSPLPREAVTR